MAWRPLAVLGLVALLAGCAVPEAPSGDTVPPGDDATLVRILDARVLALWPALRLGASPCAPGTEATVRDAAQAFAQSAPAVRAAALQAALVDLGHYRDAVDGVWGPRSRQAMRAFEAAAGLQPAGDPTASRLAAAARALMARVGARACGEAVSGDNAPQAVEVTLRTAGGRTARAWGTGPVWATALVDALGRARSGLTLERALAVDTVEASLARGFRDRPAVAPPFDDAERGIVGLELSHRSLQRRHAPSHAIETNRSLELLRRRFAEEAGVTPAEVRVRTFESLHFLVPLAPEAPGAIVLERGNRFVAPEAVTPTSVRAFAHLAADWLDRNVEADGRLPYGYHPSASRASQGENALRQWMATLALGRAARRFGGAERLATYERNVAHNLRRFYRRRGDLGVIEHDGKVKLGAVALAALALRQHPDPRRWATEETALLATVDALWREDGAFRSFLEPAGRNDNQNFYPGEALLLWADVLARDPDPGLLARALRSFEHYRDWHRASRNPAFVPWHTQACFRLWQVTGDPRLAEFVLEMNDWLVGLQQQVDDVPYRDMQGRFHAPGRDFGPPHASSTAVYVEGLADALRLARAVGDTAREQRYRQAVVAGLRSLMQLQFVDEADLYYVAERNRPRVHGGLRTTVYDNRIRIDNVQHALMAALGFLSL